MRSLFGTRTLIIIAHRLSTVREADQIVVLDQGSISETSSHDELLNQGGLYQRLHQLQETGELLEWRMGRQDDIPRRELFAVAL